MAQVFQILSSRQLPLDPGGLEACAATLVFFKHWSLMFQGAWIPLEIPLVQPGLKAPVWQDTLIQGAKKYYLGWPNLGENS